MVARRNTVLAIAIQWQPANRTSVAIEALQVTPAKGRSDNAAWLARVFDLLAAAACY